MLRGLQLSFVSDIEPYEITNPPPNTLQTPSGTAIVTRIEGEIIWARYGNGTEQPHVLERSPSDLCQEKSSPEQPNQTCQHLLNATPTPEPTKRQRRHSPKGKASGTIKERRGNTRRKKPSISYFYEWFEKGKKRTLYIPTRQIEQVRTMIDSRCSVNEILHAISTPTSHNPQNPTFIGKDKSINLQRFSDECHTANACGLR
ncbi:hypothetical protein H6G89_14715 [Oscillatoria sp. FACHB-1407]|uniref:hypothetical protein n=1 Tax=Oscillatoria sp. FACHB-1407 TaxID=2692847 RepID=UPI00168793CB|nr:hypothetical protein [Oscillatoria sp. FACHB-1407]MBD2462298.1 hypothetical protein [Oscillatoria sp. FACHB-1407]